MPIARYHWPRVADFRNRTAELRALDRWWKSTDAQPISMSGRRRVGKSWLFRRFAHGKPAIVLVADRVAPGMLLDRLADQLAEHTGFRPRLDGPADLVRMLFRLARDERILAVIDEFPYLLGTTSTEQQRHLSSIQAVMEEERDASRLKLILTGSTIGVMEGMQEGRSPMHGRLRPLQVRPLRFGDAQAFLGQLAPGDRVATYSVAGGMPRYLTALGHGNLLDAIVREVVDPDGPLFNEPLSLLTSELREPAVHFSVLAALATRPQQAAAIADAVHLSTQELTVYLRALESLHLISRHLPVGAKKGARGTQWRIEDDFMRFWFRFVHPYRGDLEAGIDPEAFADHRVRPFLNEHVSVTFERIVEDWLRREYGARAPAVGGWWGPALNALRRTGERTTEEVDVVAVDGGRVVAVAEAKWTSAPMPLRVLTDLRDFKLPAVRQAGLDVDDAEIVLASQSGLAPNLRAAADADPRVRLVDAGLIVADLERAARH